MNWKLLHYKTELAPADIKCPLEQMCIKGWLIFFDYYCYYACFDDCKVEYYGLFTCNTYNKTVNESKWIKCYLIIIVAVNFDIYKDVKNIVFWTSRECPEFEFKSTTVSQQSYIHIWTNCDGDGSNRVEILNFVAHLGGTLPFYGIKIFNMFIHNIRYPHDIFYLNHQVGDDAHTRA